VSRYRLSVFYDLAKAAVNRLAFSQGDELAPHQATAVAITPGWLRSEMMLDVYDVTEDNWCTAAAPPGFAVSESPRHVGRAVVALATDPTRQRWNQPSVTSAQLAAEYGFTDIDGSRPDAWRYNEAVEDGNRDASPSDYRWCPRYWLIPPPSARPTTACGRRRFVIFALFPNLTHDAPNEGNSFLS
jgi:hypothetical protein